MTSVPVSACDFSVSALTNCCSVLTCGSLVTLATLPRSPLPSPPSATSSPPSLSWCTRCSRGSAHDAHEVDRFDAKHVVALVATYYIPFPPPFEAEHEGRRLKPLVRIFAFLTISLCLCICMCLNASRPICPDLRAGGKNPPSCPKQGHKENRSNSKDQSTPLPPSEQQQPRCRRPGCAAREQTEQARYSILPDNWPAKPKLLNQTRNRAEKPQAEC